MNASQKWVVYREASVCVCLLQKMFCAQVIVQHGPSSLIFRQNVRQIVYLAWFYTAQSNMYVCVPWCTYTRICDMKWALWCVCLSPCVRVLLMACLISLIRQWVKQCGCDYWPACQPCWPLLWRPLKHCSLLVPETLTESFISATYPLLLWLPAPSYTLLSQIIWIMIMFSLWYTSKTSVKICLRIKSLSVDREL